MARSVPWRRSISDAASWHQDQALSSTIYILRQTGPTGFLLKEEGETKKFKVFLGDPHTCTCPVFAKEKDLCKHICWVLLKKFRVPRQNPVTWQLGLVEREINEILHGVLTQQEAQHTMAARKYAKIAHQMGRNPEDDQSVIQQREISEEDVCPICQDELLAKHLPVTYCKFGCGNNVHIKCMKVWADHQKSSGKTIIECPFCREDFGPISLLQQEMKNSSQREMRADRMNEHLGTTCKKCHVCPIKGKCYKCSTCNNYHLCQACFNTPVHMDHSFLFRQRAAQRWRPAANRSQGGMLPEAIVNNLMTREISEEDYDLLLQLDNQSAQELSDLTEETVQSFPMERVRPNGPLLAPGQQCRICLHGYEVGQFVRRLPCHHKYHRDCIDNWLLHQHPTCPIDGTVYSNESVRQMKEANRERLRQLQHNSSDQTRQVPGTDRRRIGSHQNTTVMGGNIDLEIPGIGIARMTTSAHNTVQHSQRNQDDSDGDGISNLPIQNGRGEDHPGENQTVGALINRQFQNVPSRRLTLSGQAIVTSDHDDSEVDHSLNELIDLNVRPSYHEMLEDHIVNIMASTNRRCAENGNGDDEFSGVPSCILTDPHTNSSSPVSLMGYSSSVSPASSGQRRSHVGEVNVLPKPSDGSHLADELNSVSGKNELHALSSRNIVLDHSPHAREHQLRKESLLRETRSQRLAVQLPHRQNEVQPRRNSNRQFSHEGHQQDQLNININGQGVRQNSEAQNASHGESENSHIPSIPLPRSVKDVSLGIGTLLTGGENVMKKPPSGDGSLRQGRLRTRVPYRDTDRNNSRGCDRSRSHDRMDYNFDSLYIGHSPTSRVGFNSDFLLSSAESRSSKSSQRDKTRQNIRPKTESHTPKITDISLSGYGLPSLQGEQSS